jgi:methyl-accepting chemotaxis protein
MFRTFSNIPIFQRLAITFVVATLIPILVILLLGNFSLQSGGVRSQAVQTSFDAQNVATQEQINLERMNALLQARFAQVFAQGSSALHGDPSLRASGALTGTEVSALELDFSQTLVSYQQNYELASSANMSIIRSILKSDAPDHGQQVINDQLTALNAVAQSEWQNYQTFQDKVLQDLGTNVSYEVAYSDFYQANLDFLPLKNHWQQVVDAATTMGTTVTHIGPSFTNPLLLYIAIALLLTLLVITAAGFLINATIINPLRQLVTLTKRVAQGDTDVRAAIRGRDEINQVASSMNGMLDNIIWLAQEAQARHANLQTQIEQMLGDVSGVGEGNLQIQLHVTSDELGRLADSFNAMVGQLSSLVVNVKLLTRGVQNSALQAFGYMEQLVDNTDAQIENITKATGEVNHVAASSQQVAERTQTLFNVAHEARQSAQRGRKAALQSVRGMENINKNVGATSKKVLSLGDRSREVSGIIQVISGIAQQTNRLALDASIQAAMAGDHGKGFGAVAIDIRRQAEIVKEQSALVIQIVHNVLDDINAAAQAIRETERETTSGTHLAHEVGEALERLFSAVEHQASEIEVTHQVATQQLQSSNMTAQLMLRLSDSAQQSNVITRNVAQQIERLAPLAGQLLASVEVFKLRGDHFPQVVVSEVTPGATRGLQGPGGSLSSSRQSANGAYQRPSSSPNFPDPVISVRPPVSQGSSAQPEWQQQQKVQPRKSFTRNRLSSE